MSDAPKRLMKKAYDLGYKYEGQYGACAQATMRALQEVYDEMNPDVYRAMAGFAAGGGIEGDGMCGAYVASIYCLSSKYGRRLEDLDVDPDDPGAEKIIIETSAQIKKVHDKFIEKYGSVICHHIHRKLYGRPYYVADPEELEKFYAAGAHDWGCTSVCGDAARWTVEVLEANR
jgi:C_GCAxxG_C_C family probable redox protein